MQELGREDQENSRDIQISDSPIMNQRGLDEEMKLLIQQSADQMEFNREQDELKEEE